ncbi:D-sedoheptulose-7-phosphate isomerase [Actinoallomurus rhizosphaericola]|nr:SIS domain-containing protein [Actinoallomurus rhizosphaericola]MCO5993722.1 SIS domain-containing protein [Actinoallomurus rhizosphaericola]
MIASHLTALEEALRRFQAQTPRLESWGRRLATVLEDGGRLLACGNGGSAEQAQHLTAELVGRYQTERRPFAAIPLHTDISALTAIGNDYGHEEMFARQVRAHGRPGDVLICLSTSGSSKNIIAAAKAAAEVGVRAWALTGPGPNPLAGVCAEAITVEAPSTATVQEVHLAAIHMLCAAIDAVVCGTRDGAVMCGTGDGAMARGTGDGAVVRGTADGAMGRGTGDVTVARGAGDGARRVMDLDREAEETV